MTTVISRFYAMFVCATAWLWAASPSFSEPPIAAPSVPAKQAVDRGLRVFVCGHSFHIFTARYLGPLAKMAELADHATVGSQMIGGSSVTQHWNLPDEKNRCKTALRAGNVDVLTLSPNWVVPDPAIEQFTALGLARNPQLRVVVQMSWTIFDGLSRDGFVRSNVDRDAKTMADLRPPQERFAKLIETQIDAINAKYDRRVVAVSPVGYAVLKLREAVIEGRAPGIAKQSDLYRDALGHGTAPIMALCTYVNFATIYGRTPVGLPPFDNFDGAVSPELHKLLQEIAWATVKEYEPSGVAEAPKASR